METNEQALLAVLSDHLEVTEKLLEHYVKLVSAVRLQCEIAGSLPASEPHPTLQELYASTQLLRQGVRSILERK